MLWSLVVVKKLDCSKDKGPGTEFSRTAAVRLKVEIRGGKPFVLGIEWPWGGPETRV